MSDFTSLLDSCFSRVANASVSAGNEGNVCGRGQYLQQEEIVFAGARTAIIVALLLVDDSDE